MISGLDIRFMLLACLIWSIENTYCFDILHDLCPSKVYHNIKEPCESLSNGFGSLAKQTPDNCSLKSTDIENEKFVSILQNKPDFIFLQLNMEYNTSIYFSRSEFEYLDQSFNYIDPLSWVLGHGYKGRFILGLPVTFRYMFLGSLLPGVDTAKLTISVSDDSCPQFVELCDNVKLQVIARHILNFTEQVNSSIFHDDSFVCQDKAFDVYGSSLNNFLSLTGFDYIVMYQSEMECWDLNGIPLGDVVSPYWISKKTIIFAVFIQMLYPLCTLWLIRTNPPKVPKRTVNDGSYKQEEMRYVGKATEIGIGLKFILLHSQLGVLRVLRGLLVLCILLIIIFPGLIVQYIFDDSESSFKRWSAYFRMGYVECVLYSCFKIAPFLILCWVVLKYFV